ncbi:hypothetical protein AMECASPLE_008633 [Ameca splendens]|uniref:Uncharacterized protein n=1 Tax=Ameca splendens TaxID=208324 RepID=A0ABV0YM37_9TELE
MLPCSSFTSRPPADGGSLPPQAQSYKVNWPWLSIRRLMHRYIFIHKAILGLFPLHLCSYISLKQSSHRLRSQDVITFSGPLA